MYGTLDADDIVPDPGEFGLTEGASFVLIDSADLQLTLPENFLKAVQHNILAHPNLRHMAIVTNSLGVKMLTHTVSRLLGKQEQVSVHIDFAAAEAHLLDLIHQDGL
jgi:hypothetical protein